MMRNCYNEKGNRGPEGRGRCVMRRAMTCGVLALALAALGCEDNEITFFVEHVKAPPAAPECEVTASDPMTPGGLLDLSFRNSYTAWYLLHNSLVSREDYSNLVAETNGIHIEGSEAYVRGTDGTMYGSTEYYELQLYVDPEQSGIAMAINLPAAIVAEIAADRGCPELSAAAFPWGSGTRDAGGMVYTVVRFLGHTSGGVDVETPEFTFPVELCCGCLVDWAACDTQCNTYCRAPGASGMCTEGVANGGALFDCANLYYNPDETWTAGSDAGAVTQDCLSCEEQQ